jgi:hypothetical protein
VGFGSSKALGLGSSTQKFHAFNASQVMRNWRIDMRTKRLPTEPEAAQTA